MTYHIGCNGIIDNCKYIALIDVDEFIYIPNSENCIKLFLKNENFTLRMKSKMLTNKENIVLDNNITTVYSSGHRYHKILIHRDDIINDRGFIESQHKHQNMRNITEDQIFHYHCWCNDRLPFSDEMNETHHLIDFMQDN